MKCTDCFYCEWFAEEQQGFCHRYPPIYSGEVITYPVVDESDWCGEIIPISKERH